MWASLREWCSRRKNSRCSICGAKQERCRCPRGKTIPRFLRNHPARRAAWIVAAPVLVVILGTSSTAWAQATGPATSVGKCAVDSFQGPMTYSRLLPFAGGLTQPPDKPAGADNAFYLVFPSASPDVCQAVPSGSISDTNAGAKQLPAGYLVVSGYLLSSAGQASLAPYPAGVTHSESGPAPAPAPAPASSTATVTLAPQQWRQVELALSLLVFFSSAASVMAWRSSRA